MMAKMFYTLDEAKAALTKSEEEIKQLAREGRLREFRDGPRLMFKADQVEALRTEFQGEDKIELTGPTDSGAPIGLADSRGGSNIALSGSGIGSPSSHGSVSGSSAGAASGSGMGSGAAAASGSGLGSGMGSGMGSGVGSGMESDGRSPGVGMTLKEDTALAADLGLSGSIGGMPSPTRSPGGTAAGMGSVHGSRAGVDVFHDDDVERVDPAAQTAISAGISDQVNVESVGSGSGLLDLTRESDDTSLGAELLDEIAPGGAAPRRSPGETVGVGGLVESRGPGTGFRLPSGGMPEYVERADPMAAAFGGAALGATFVVLFGAFALIAGVLDNAPAILTTLSNKGNLFLLVGGGGIAVSIVFFVIGMIFGKTLAR